MDIKTILENFHRNNIIDKETICAIQNKGELRIDLINYFRNSKGRIFATQLLETFVTIRKQPNGEMSAEDLMIACYVLGLHNNIEDCLKIWDAKSADFDTYCGLDIQLIAFAGVNETINFLKMQTTEEGEKAFYYVSECNNSGDFDDLENYFSKEELPWFI
jgi:uncharacterized protein (UPF0335 family)